jgi:hypothetical protein
MKPLNKRFFSQLLVLGMLALMSLPFLGGCNNPSNTHKPLSAGLVKWVGSEATAQKLLDFRLPSEPMGLALYKHNPDSYATELKIPDALGDELALFGFTYKGDMETSGNAVPWLWMPNLTPEFFTLQNVHGFTELDWQSLQASATQGQKRILELPELFKLSRQGLFNTKSPSPFYSIPRLNETLVCSSKWGAFLFPSTEHEAILPYLNELLKVNQGGWNTSKSSWKLSEHLLPVLKDTFTEFPNTDATAESFTFLNLSGIANPKLKGIMTLKPTWIVKSTSPQTKLANGNLQESSGLLIQLPQRSDTNTPPLDLNTLEYLLKGSERPLMSASPSLSYVSVQHVDRLLKKGFIERLPEEKQNQIKMLNPILSLFHLNVEKDLLGLLSKRTLLVVNEQGHRAVVLEPTPDKQKTLNALVKHLGQGGSLNEVVLKSKASSNKQVLDVLPWKDQATLLKVNDALALSPFLKPLRVYRSSQGIFLSGKEFFEHSSPQQLDAYLHFDPKAQHVAPWLSFQYPNLIASVAVLIPPALREKTPALARVYEQLHASGIRSFEGGVNLSNRTQYALSGQFVVTHHPKSAQKGLAHFLPTEEVAFYSNSIGLWATALAKEDALFNTMHVAKK